MGSKTFIDFQDVTLRVGGRWLLAHTSWKINLGEHWVIWGPNGAGKTTLAKALMGQVAVVRGRIQRHYPTAKVLGTATALSLVSPDQYHHLYQRAQLMEEMRHFSGLFKEKVSTLETLPGGRDKVSSWSRGRWPDLIRVLNVEGLLDRPLEALSSGETARLMIARALADDPVLLILDEPFNGLDRGAREQLMLILERLAAAGIQLILITHRLNEIAPCFSHVIRLELGRAVWQGSKTAFRVQMNANGRIEPAAPAAPVNTPLAAPGADESSPLELIRMRRVTVRYGDATVLTDIDWTVRQGEHWALIGPNGAGKSTLLRLISGDNLQGYANELFLFGRRKGTGESVWEHKSRIGVIGDDIQARYQRRLSGYDVICSGFFDSVGLYRRCSAEQHDTARQWIDTLGLHDLIAAPFAQLSFGQQRLILVARAMVKSPLLLILDEPCNGLDQFHRRRLLALLEAIGRGGFTGLLYVSHRSDEVPACITHRLYLDGGRVTARVPAG